MQEKLSPYIDAWVCCEMVGRITGSQRQFLQIGWTSPDPFRLVSLQRLRNGVFRGSMRSDETVFQAKLLDFEMKQEDKVLTLRPTARGHRWLRTHFWLWLHQPKANKTYLSSENVPRVRFVLSAPGFFDNFEHVLREINVRIE